MKLKNVLIIILLMCISNIHGKNNIVDNNFYEQFNQLYYNDSISAAKQLLDIWEKTGQREGDYYACQYKYYYNQAVKSTVTLTVELPLYAYNTNYFTLQDTINGGNAGYMYEGYIIVDSLLLDSAFHWIDKGINECPNRLDLYFGLATSYLYCDQIDEMIETLENVMKQERKNKGKWLWTNDEKLPKSADALYSRIQEDIPRFVDAGELDKAEKLARIVLKYYPKRAEYWNNMGAIYYMRENFTEALYYFKKALKLNPKDEYVKGNIELLEEQITSVKQ